MTLLPYDSFGSLSVVHTGYGTHVGVPLALNIDGLNATATENMSAKIPIKK